MLRKAKHIQSLVLLLFFGAWMLQSISPLLPQLMGNDHVAVMCSVDGDSGSSCSKDGVNECNCNHAHANHSKDDSGSVTICGCDHHGNELAGTASPFQIKASPLAAYESVPPSPITFVAHPNYSFSFLFADEIFHPPRSNA